MKEIISICMAVALALGVGAWLAWEPLGTKLGVVADEKPKKITVRGTVEAPWDHMWWIIEAPLEMPDFGDTCVADPQHEDIAVDGDVTVTNDTGRTVGVGRLRKGTIQDPSDWQLEGDPPLAVSKCVFPFTVKVKPGYDFYSIQVGDVDRDAEGFTRAELRKPVVISIG